MKRIVNFHLIYISCFLIFIALSVYAEEPPVTKKPPSFFALNEQNPHYFDFKGKPTVLITSAEHYGAVINLDFDYKVYLKELKKHKFNLTRLFIGNYVENVGWFKYPKEQPLSPAPTKLTVPWARSSEPGYINGGNKFDLNSYNPDYFERLHNFLKLADKYKIVVEIVLFCPFYTDQLWEYSPWHFNNNINEIGNLDRNTPLTLNNGTLLEIQDKLVQKIVTELQNYDNIYYEICNEPYVTGVPMDWQNHIIEKITKAEESYKNKHLIAINVQNGTSKIVDANPKIDIFNWHYAYPEKRTLNDDIATLNYHLNKAIANDETGMTTDASFYRKEGWESILAGCAVYNNLDLSFLTTDEKGKTIPETVNSGGPVLRKWLEILKNFISSFDFIRMKPQNEVIVSGVPENVRARVLAETGKQYAIYFRGGEGQIMPEIELPEGKYHIEWLNTKTGKTEKKEFVHHSEKTIILKSPNYSEDIALAIRSR